MKLTAIDKIILDSYASMVEALSGYLGSAYEISLHSLEDYNHSVIRIMNGYHSGRTEGAPLTDLAINMLKRIGDEGLSATSSYTLQCRYAYRRASEVFYHTDSWGKGQGHWNALHQLLS